MQKTLPARPEQITRTYYMISGLYTLSASLIWGVNTLFLLAAGLNIFQVFIVNAIFSAGMTLFEFPTGVLADTRGRRLSFLLSTLVLAVGTFGYVIGANLPGGVTGRLPTLAVMSVVMGLGYTFYSGAVEAWLVDSLKASGYQGQLDAIFARSSFISGAAMLVGTISGGLLGSLSLAIPYLVRSALLVLLFVLAYFSMHETGFQPRAVTLRSIPGEMKTITQVSLRYGWMKPGLRLIMLMSFLQTGYQFWGFYAWPPYFLALLGRDAVWVSGVITALISLATMGGNALVDRLARYCGKRTTLLLSAAAVSTLAIIGVGLVHSFVPAVALFLLSMVAQGVTTPVQQAYLHQLIPSEQRAAIVSFNSMVGNGGGILGQTGLGYLSQERSIAAGYVVGGAATVLVLPLLWALRKMRDPADAIVGEAGKQSACAAQGIPAISNVETTTGEG